MKKILIACLILLTASCYSPERNCKKFHTGTFEFQSYLNGKLVSSKFIRTDSTEIDIFQGKADTSSIRWVNDCEYIVTNLHPKNMKEKKPLSIRILTTDKNSYTFEYGVVGDSKKKKGKATKID